MKPLITLMWIIVCYMLVPLSQSILHAQTTTDLLFIAFNSDGDDDFAIVVLNDLAANTTIYFTDKEPDGSGGLTTGEGVLQWDTGNSTIPSGTTITFTDVDSAGNPNFGVTIGTLTASNSFNLSSLGDALFAYLGTDENTPTVFLAGIQNGTSAAIYGTLEGTGLTIGKDFIQFTQLGTPDGGYYAGNRFGKKNYDQYIKDLNNYQLWVTDASDGETILPINTESFSTFNSTWNGNTDSDWNTPSNWTPNEIPTAISDIYIPNTVSNYPTSTTSITAKGITLESNATLVANDQVNAPIQFHRILNTSNWYIVSSPLANGTLERFIADNAFDLGNGQNIGIGTYAQDQHIWNYENEDSSGALSQGHGYAVKLQTNDTLKFNGTFNSDIETLVDLNTGLHSYNLIGNPYTSFVELNGLLQENTSVLTEQSIWIWNQAENTYSIYNTESNYYLAPGQGFFVKANTSGNFKFFKTMGVHHGTDTFLKTTTAVRPKIIVRISDGKQTRKTELQFLKKASIDFDNGLDSSIFYEHPEGLSIYTQVASKKSNHHLGIQSLPEASLKGIVVPLGISAQTPTTITLSMKTEQLSKNSTVYLEDTHEKTFTLLDSKNSMTLKLNTTPEEFNRFKLHINTPMDTPNNSFQAYQTTNQQLVIKGLENAAAIVELYNSFGALVLQKTFSEQEDKVLKLPRVAMGIYFVKVELHTMTKSIPIVLK